MPVQPRPADIPRIRGALAFYRLFAYVTGGFLLLLCAEMVVRYGFGLDLELGGDNGFLALTPREQVIGANLSTGILIVHGWLYVVYLFSDFRLWILLLWPFTRVILIALGGVIPFLSFITEHFISRRVRAELADLEGAMIVGNSRER